MRSLATMPTELYPCGHPVNPRVTSCYACMRARKAEAQGSGPVGHSAYRFGHATIDGGPPTLGRVWVDKPTRPKRRYRRRTE
jgi:hypothetical protein